MYYSEQMKTLASELNKVFMANESFVFKMDGTQAIGMQLKSSTFSDPKDQIHHVSPAGQAKINEYIKNKYNVDVTWHHQHCFGIYTDKGQANIFMKDV